MQIGLAFFCIVSQSQGYLKMHRFALTRFSDLQGVALQTGATTLSPFAAGRVFAGLGVGITSCLIPLVSFRLFFRRVPPNSDWIHSDVSDDSINQSVHRNASEAR